VPRPNLAKTAGRAPTMSRGARLWTGRWTYVLLRSPHGKYEHAARRKRALLMCVPGGDSAVYKSIGKEEYLGE